MGRTKKALLVEYLLLDIYTETQLLEITKFKRASLRYYLTSGLKKEGYNLKIVANTEGQTAYTLKEEV